LVAGNHAGYSQELFKFSTETLTWTNLAFAMGGPSARYGHAMTVVGTDIYLFGGITNGGESKTELELEVATWLGVWLRHVGWYCREVHRLFCGDCMRADELSRAMR
jgi:hypothetical protein